MIPLFLRCRFSLVPLFSHFLFGFGFCGLPFGVGSDCDSTISYLRSSSFTLGRHQSYEAVCICAVRAAAHERNPVWSFSTVSGPFSAKIWPPSVGRCSCRDSSSDMARIVTVVLCPRSSPGEEDRPNYLWQIAPYPSYLNVWSISSRLSLCVDSLPSSFC